MDDVLPRCEAQGRYVTWHLQTSSTLPAVQLGYPDETDVMRDPPWQVTTQWLKSKRQLVPTEARILRWGARGFADTILRGSRRDPTVARLSALDDPVHPSAMFGMSFSVLPPSGELGSTANAVLHKYATSSRARNILRIQRPYGWCAESFARTCPPCLTETNLSLLSCVILTTDARVLYF